MNRWQKNVEDFHRAMDIPVGGYPPEIRRPGLRAKLIMEEAAETCAALGFHVDYVLVDPVTDDYLVGQNVKQGDQDLIEAIDGLVDLIVVALGTAVEMGIDLDSFWEEVHRANMAKVGGPKREDGKQLKPEGWQPPDHRVVLQREYGISTREPL